MLLRHEVESRSEEISRINNLAGIVGFDREAFRFGFGCKSCVGGRRREGRTLDGTFGFDDGEVVRVGGFGSRRGEGSGDGC